MSPWAVLERIYGGFRLMMLIGHAELARGRLIDGLFRTFRSPVGGATSGMCVAFRSPVGGMLFALEEVVTWWRAHRSYGVGGRYWHDGCGGKL